MSYGYYGAAGSPGGNGVNPGDSGTAGGAGGDYKFVNPFPNFAAKVVGGAGGAGGSGNPFGGSAGAGGNGGYAKNTSTTQLDSPSGLLGYAAAIGGSGGNAGYYSSPGHGADGGNGGAATAKVSATDNIAFVTSKAYATGGAGGAGQGVGFSGGAGGTATATAGAYARGAGPTYAKSTALGGAGGAGFYGANGAAGGTANAQAVVSGAGGINVVASATGGRGGAAKYAAGDGGTGGAAKGAQILAGTTSGFAFANADETGGSGGSGYGAGHSGGAGGAAYGSFAFASGDSAQAEATQAGGAGGLGLAGADGGAGGDSTLTNGVAGRSRGGYLRLFQTATGGTGGDGLGGSGGRGGSAIASSVLDDTANPVAASSLYGKSTAFGGGGGNAHYGTASAGAGGGASAAVALRGAHTVDARAYAYGGAGGSGLGQGQSGAAGGAASGTAAYASGYSASARVAQTGGAGGGGYSGGGAGADSTLTNAVSGRTSGGYLTLSQTAIGGAGGDGGEGSAGAGGNAYSSLAFDDTANPVAAVVFSGNSTAYGGAGGTGGTGKYGATGGGAFARAVIVGTGETSAVALAIGGAGGAAGHQGANGGAGGVAKGAQALMAVATGTGFARAYETGGSGGIGFGAGYAGGAGGAATGSLAFASGYSASVKLSQTGGAGGFGADGADGGAGGDSAVVGRTGGIISVGTHANPPAEGVSGATTGGFLDLSQTATGGAGGYSSTGVGGRGGAALSSFNFDDTKNAVAASSIYGRNKAVGGAGGSTASGSKTGGAGGAASGLVSVKGSHAVTAYGYVYGGTGGNGGIGGNGGAATGSHASATSTATIGRTYARAIEIGGMGGTGFGPGDRGGAHAGAGGAASGSSAFAAGFSAVAAVQQTGGAGGIGLNEASGGAGGSSTLADAVAGQTGGGYLELLQTATGGAGGDSHGSNGGRGGLATSSLTFDDTANLIASNFIKGVSAAYGGNGGASLSDFSKGFGNGGVGGLAQSSIDLTGTNIVKTYADAVGGAGGRGYGSGHSGGAGGTASAAHSFASGHSVRAAAYQRGGDGGGGTGGANGGTGAASTLTDAVSGQTTGGYLNLNQVAVGGAGGYSVDGTAGAGGAASSAFSFDDRSAPFTASSLYGRGIARGGAGGNGSYGGAGGGTAYASVDVTGAHSVKALAGAYGGAGGKATLDGIGGAGGAASAYARADTTGSDATALAKVTAGTGGDGSTGGAGGAATGATAKARELSLSAGTQSYAKSVETAGAGGRGSGAGQSGGSGGTASGSSAFATGLSARALVYQTGGAGGVGSDGASGGAGGNSTLANAAIGYVFGGYLHLIQVASGGRGGDDEGGLAGKGGSASSALVYLPASSNFAASKVTGRSAAKGGDGGGASLSAAALGPVTGGAGGGAAATIDVTGVNSVSADADSAGGAGGFGYGSGQSGGAGGTATVTSARGSGQSAMVSAEQTGGAGGLGLFGAAGGAGANSTLNNAVSGRTTGGYLELSQTATGGAGGVSYGAAGGAGGSASSSFVFNDITANPVQASSLYGRSAAVGGAGGNGYTVAGAGGSASAKVDLTGANGVSAFGYARGGQGGSADAGGGAAGGDAYAEAVAYATSPGATGTATAQATAFGGAGATAGMANAIAAAVTSNGQQAQATSVARGLRGDADAIAKTDGSGVVASVRAEADAEVGSTNTSIALSLADAGSAYGFDDGSHNAYDFATELPSASYIAGALQSHGDVDSVLGATGASVFGAATQGYASDVNGARDYLSNTTWVLDTSTLTGDLVLGLLDTQTLGSGFDSLELDVFVGESLGQPSLVFHTSVTSLAAAQAFFTDHALDLGGFASVPDLAVTVSLDLVTSSQGTGFGVDYLLGVGNAPPVTTVPGPQLVQQGIATPIAGISVADADADTAGETITVVLSDASGLLSATGSGVTGSGTTLTISGSLAQVNADLATLSLQETTFGSDTIDVATSDGRGGSDEQQIAVKSNAAPLAADDTYVMLVPGQEIDIGLDVQGNGTPGVLANDTDADGDTLSAHLVLDPFHAAKHGFVTLSADGSFVYTPNPGYAGPDSFSYFASDGSTSSNIATVSLRVAPVARPDFYLLAPGQSLNIPSDEAAISGVLVNDSDVEGDPLTASLIPGGDPAHGTLSLNSDGSFTYTPNAGFHGADSFTYVANDGFSDSNTATVSLAVDTPPVAVNDTYVMLVPGQEIDIGLDPDGNGTPGVLANDTDADGDTLSAHLFLDPLHAAKHGFVTVSADGSFVYVPNPGYAGPDSFSYFASDGLWSSNIATVSLRVAPVARPDFYLLAPGQSLNIPSDEAAISGVLVNDSDVEGDPLTASLIPGGDPAHGTLSLNSDGSFTYTPNAGFHGADSFTYVANDGFSDSNTATVTLAVDTPPVAVNDTYVMLVPGQEIDIGLDPDGNGTPGVLANDTDADGDTLSAHLFLDPLHAAKHGFVTVSADGSFVYVPNPGYAGPDSFSYFASDGLWSSNIATVSLRVAPVARPDFYLLAPGQSLNIPSDEAAISGVLVNDFDAQGDPLTASLVPGGGPANGTLSLNPDGSFTYTPNGGFHGADSFTYVANDGFSDSSPATVTLAVDTPPTAVDDTYFVAPGRTLDTNLAQIFGVLGNDTDAESDPLVARLWTSPLHGHVNLSTDGSFVYTPNVGFEGIDTFKYFASDGLASSGIAKVTINVVNLAPVAAADSYVVAPGGSLDTDQAGLSGVLANDSDLDGDPLTAQPQTGPSHGSLVLHTDGSFVYTPDPLFDGTDSFTYLVNDGVFDSNVATVTLHVNASPVAKPDFYLVAPNQTLKIATDEAAVSGVLVNDFDAEGDPLTASLAPNGGPANGALSLNPDGSFTYTPNAGFHGADSFTYVANDGFSGSNTATVSLAVDTPPVAVNDTYVMLVPGQEIDIGLDPDGNGTPGVLANDTDADGDTLSAHLFLDPFHAAKHGFVTVSADGSFVYVPNPGYAGPDSFSYFASDGLWSGNIATVSLRVAPVARADFYLLAPGQSLNIPSDEAAISGVLVNDFDAEGDPLTASLAPGGGPANGTLSLNPDGSFTYTPNAGFHGADSFTYVANDGFSDSNTATVTLAVDTPPVAVNDTYVMLVPGQEIDIGLDPDGNGTPGVLANDTDADGDTLSALALLDPFDAPKHGHVTLSADGSFVYTANLGYIGPDSFSYFASDGLTSSNIATVTLRVPPVAQRDAYLVAPGQSLIITPDEAAVSGVLVNDLDAAGDPLTASLAPGGGPADGTLSLNSDGSFTYTPNADFHGVDTFTYVANDGFADSQPTRVSLNVDTAPVAVDDTYFVPPDGTLDTNLAGIFGVLGNDTDAENDPLAAIPWTRPLHGGLRLSVDGSFVYTPVPGFEGTDSFSYFATDGLAASIANVTINVVPNAPPVTTVPGTQLVQQGIATPIPGISVADADADAAGETITVVLSDSTGLLSATVAGVTESGTTLTISGSLADVNAELATLMLQEIGFGSDTIDVATSDGRGGSDDHKIAVTSNAPPVLHIASTQLLAKQGVQAPISMFINDADAGGETFTLALSDTSGLLFASAAGEPGSVSGSGSTQLTIVGGRGAINSILSSSLTFEDNASGSDTIDVALSDGRGGSDDEKIAVSIYAPLVTTVPGPQFAQQGIATAISGISVADPTGGAAGEIITAVLTDTSGLFSATGTGVSGVGTTQLSIVGDLAQINADLATLTLQENDLVADSIDVAVTGSDDHQIAIATNAPPVLHIASTQLLAQQGVQTSISMFINDADAGGETFTLVLSDTSGLLFASAAGQSGSVSGSGSTQLTIVGGRGAINSILSSSLTFEDNTYGSDTIDVALGDGRGGSDHQTIAVSINAPPVTTVPGAQFVQQGVATALTGFSIADADADSAGETITVVLSDTNGLLSATGTGVTGSGTTLTISGSLAQVNADLATLSLQESTFGSDTIDVATSDGRGGSDDHQIAVSINTSPVIAVVVSAPANPIEHHPSDVQVATFTSSNPTDTSTSYTATIEWGDGTGPSSATISGGNGLFTVSGSGTHTYADEGDYTATVTVTRTADGSTSEDSGTITVAEGDVLTPGSATAFSANANQAFSGIVATFSDIVASPASDFTATINWGDGTTSTGDVSVVNGTFVVSGTHAYTAAGVDFVGVTLTDDAPGTATATSFATAYVGAVVAIAVGQPLSVAPVEGSLFSGQVASFSSSNRFDAAASYAAMIDWGDGTTSPGTISELQPGAFFVSGVNHHYADEGDYTARVTITRLADGTSTAGSGKITVLDADALLASPVQPVDASAGQTFNAVATFTDFPSLSSQASPASDFTATIDWGDGTTTAGVVSGGSGGFGSGIPETLTVSGSHAYTIADRHSFTVTLSDDAPGAVTATSTGTVYVGAVLGITVDSSVGPPPVEQRLFSGQVATFNSSNLVDTAASYSAVIDWGDGTSAGTISGSNGFFTVSGDHFYLDDGSYPMKVTVERTADGRASTGFGQITVGDRDVLTPNPPLLLSANPRFDGFVATFADTDLLTPQSDFVASIDWGDGTTTSGGVSGQDGTFAVFGSHTYAATGRDKVTVTLGEDGGGTRAAVSVTTMIVETLSVALSGTAREGALLIATPTLSGNSSGSVADVTYQWMRNGSAIGGATGSTYQLAEADELTHITVQASFTDAGTGQTLHATSNPSGLVLDPPPTLSVSILGTAQEDQTLQAIAVASSSDAVITYQWQQLNGPTWVNIPLATGPTYRVVEPNENHQLRVLARSSDPDSGNASATSAPTAAVIDVTPSISVTISGSAQEGQLLNATAIVTSDGDGGHTTYQWQALIGSIWVDISGATNASFRATEPVEGHALRVKATFTDDTGQSVSTTSDPTAPVADPTPTLSLTATGIAQEGRTLTAHPHITSDADGGTTAFQWQRLIGSTWTDIVGALASTYQVTEQDEGFRLRVTATFTDDTRQTVSASSATSPLVIDINPTLSVSISGTAQDGQTLTAIAIANDGDAVVSFQWQRLLGGTWTDITGATSSSYVVGDPDEGHRLRVMATSADDDGGGASAISTTTALVTDPAPTLTIANSSVFVAVGKSVPLSINVAGFDPDDSVRVTIAGLPSFETITDAVDTRIFAGSSVVLSAAEVNSGLTLHSSYTGSGQPVDTLTVTAANSEPGQFATSLPQTITVTDPPVSTDPDGPPGRNDVTGSSFVSELPDFGGGAGRIGRSVGLLANYMASAFTSAGFEGPGNVLDRAGSFMGEIPSLVQPSGHQPGA